MLCFEKFRSEGVTLRLGVQTNDVWCVIVPVGTRRALSEEFRPQIYTDLQKESVAKCYPFFTLLTVCFIFPIKKFSSNVDSVSDVSKSGITISERTSPKCFNFSAWF